MTVIVEIARLKGNYSQVKPRRRSGSAGAFPVDNDVLPLAQEGFHRLQALFERSDDQLQLLIFATQILVLGTR